MAAPQSFLLPDGKRLHLQHGPIDLIIGAEGPAPESREAAFQAARKRFASVLDELVGELTALRERTGTASLDGKIARRMTAATMPHTHRTFLTPMAAVAGAVADEILSSMVKTTPLTRAYVNNGGDIALHLSGNQSFRMAIRGIDGADLGRISLSHADTARGIATSGQGGRSLSMGIADSVTVLARDAASADAAATLIANAVDLPDHPAITRRPARDINPDSDLGERLVVVASGPLATNEINAALSTGKAVAERMHAEGLIEAASLHLRGQSCQINPSFQLIDKTVEYA